MRIEFTQNGLTLVADGGQDDYLLASFYEDWQAGRVAFGVRLTTDNEDKPPLEIHHDEAGSAKS